MFDGGIWLYNTNSPFLDLNAAVELSLVKRKNSTLSTLVHSNV